jgi:tRNA dimethylallyltransferase
VSRHVPGIEERAALLGIVGPTASGKSDLAMALAARMPSEILVADSRQVYRGMDIGTAKPTAAARAAVPHHLLDLVDPDQPFSVAQWVELAREAASAVEARGRQPLVVGGTGLYVSALVDGHDYASQPWAPVVRQRLSDELATDGLEPLASRLSLLDPAAAARTDLRNPRRVVRALERVTAGGRASTVPSSVPFPGRTALVGIDRTRDVLNARIDARAAWMFTEGGLLDEVAGLLAAGYEPDLHPMTGHGYGEAIRHLAGEWDLERAIEVTARRTRQYAKRQLTWFRRDERIRWLPAGDGPSDEPSLVAAALQVGEGSPID